MNAKKSILWIIFISCPSILLAGYVVYKIKEILLINGVLINEYIYWLILFFTMWAVMLLTSKKILKEVFSTKTKKNLPEEIHK
tara:strand:+ start:3710 stop:3958 length:249 start_codon:yes stop_codon:yes gene_type:complete